MTFLFTHEELVQYLYNETSPEKSAAIEAALQQDWILREQLDELKTSASCLRGGLESPRPEAIMNVLNYAREAFEESVQH